ncbi:putative enzyme related to lactoylglutathione lyase [Amycolatopsis lexingtonensis]|uniref:Enzyme related to lactoylglutathione lyase n=1 Tax=Amycolatopsis lexingtonensis TaxID=218822 RepID=A0ABR9IFF9_9PSEU|nr:VOC family protein [Amycolatopsis lexingtonensis]MBE1501910.1 putative enzyme related to lactoylglutathione lyase [Amycolatopsis lexingtonensis]
MPRFNDVAWFEIGATDPAAAERFYGDVFGWKAVQDESASPDPAYRVIDTGGSRGGLATGTEDYAIFTVLVEDVAAACERVEAAGGKVKRPPVVNPVGVTFAHLLDPAGNHFSVFTPPK